MGCGASVKSPSSPTQSKTSVPSSNPYITGRQRSLVRKTWRLLSGDMTRIGSKVFLYIFQLHPDIKKLFPCRDKEGKELLADANFKGHAARFMQAVGAVVDNMGDLDETLSPLLIDLGRQHVHYSGFILENFEAFVEAMTMAWSEELQWRFTYEVKDAWVVVFNYIMMKMKAGFIMASLDR